MTDHLLDDVRAQTPAERLLEDSWSARSRRASRRELLSEGAGAATFLAVAMPLAWTATRADHPALWLCALLTAVYAAVSRTVRFPVGAGHVVPSYLVLVPMFLLLPPGVVPLLVCAGLLLGSLGRRMLGRGAPEEMLYSIPDAWHAIGPAVVLLLAGSPHGGDRVGIYVAAFLAACLLDLGSSTLREWLISGIAPSVQARVALGAWLIDGCLAPLGFGIGVAARHDLVGLLLLVPLGGLMIFADRDRTARIAQAQSRLEILARERSRLQSAVHRLGDAFAAKLDLGALAAVLLHGSVEALDATDGRLDLGDPAGTPLWVRGQPDAEPALAERGERARTGGREIHEPAGPLWTLAVPVAFGPAVGSLALARGDRPFTDDERALMLGLVRRAETAAGEIVAHEALQEAALTDPLTRLGNRRKLADALAAQLAEASLEAPLRLLIFDLDGFKAYNDTFGHLAGDALLARIGRRLASAAAPAGSAFRLGGDEFCVLLPDSGQADPRVPALTRALAESGEGYAIVASCGSVVLPEEAASADYALGLADKRMYGDKHLRRAAEPARPTAILAAVAASRG